MDTSRAIATAVSQAKKVCATGRTFGGRTAVSPAARARYCNAAREWEAKKAKTKAKAVADSEIPDFRDDVVARLDILIEALTPVGVALVLAEEDAECAAMTARLKKKGMPHAQAYALAKRAVAKRRRGKKGAEVREEILDLFALYEACDGEPTSLDFLAEFAREAAENELAEATTKPRKPDRQRQNTALGGSFDEAKHPRGRAGTPGGGKFVKSGSSGPAVRAIQRGVGAKEDGQFGSITATAVSNYQRKNGLAVDGIVGKQTAASLLGNSKASKLKVGAITDRQRTRLRAGGLSKRRRSKLLREAIGSGGYVFDESNVRRDPRGRFAVWHAVLGKLRADPSGHGLANVLQARMTGGGRAGPDDDPGNFAEAAMVHSEILDDLYDAEERRRQEAALATSTPRAGVRPFSAPSALTAPMRSVTRKWDEGSQRWVVIKNTPLGEAIVEEGVLSSQARKALPAGAFVFPKDKRYPIHDLAHARNALARASGKPEEAQVRAAVYARYPALKKRVREDVLIEARLSFLRRGARDAREIARVGGGHGRESGQFSSKPIAAIGHPGRERGGRGRTLRAVSKTGEVGKVVSGPSPRHYPPPPATTKRGKVSSGRGPDVKRTPQQPKVAPIPKGPREKPEPPAVFKSGGTGERLGGSIGEAEDAIIEAVQKSPAYKQAMREAMANGAKQKILDSNGKLDTQGIYGGTPGQEHKLYSDATRRALHAEILRAIMQGTRPEDPDHKPEVMFMAGGGASGKSSILRAGLVDEPDRAALLNADVIKGCLPEYELLRQDPDDEVAKRAAQGVHEESSDLNKRAMRLAQTLGNNHVVDGVGDNTPPKFIQQIEAARAKGADVRLTYATIEVSQAMDRAQARWEGEERRYVPPEILEGAHKGAVENFLEGGKGKDGKDYPSILDSDIPFEVYDTGHQPPKLIASRKSGKGKGKVTIHDEALFENFTRRAQGLPEGGEFLPLERTKGRDLIRAVDQGRIKLSDLPPEQMTDLEKIRAEAAAKARKAKKAA